MLRPGSKLGHYRILEVLGRGGMGVVYKAHDEALARTVAVKVLLPEHLTDARYAQRLQKEARAAASLSDPHVAAILAFDREQDLTFLVMEYLPGGSLYDRLKRDGPFPWREGAALGAQIARGLAAIHRAGLVHRDVKPHNVLLDEQGRPRVADLGLAKRAATTTGDGTGGTGTGAVLGSFHYMAPEQQGDETVGPGADLYALGATLHHLVAGRPPFEGNAVELMKRHLIDEPPPLRRFVPDAPAALEAVVQRLLAKNPGDRGAGADAVARELDVIASGPEDPAPSGAGVVRAAVAFLALVLLGGVAGAALRHAAAPVPPPPVAPPPPPPSTSNGPKKTNAPRGTVLGRVELDETDPIGRLSVERTTGHLILSGAIDRRTTFLIDPERGTARRLEGEAALSGAFFHPTKAIFFGSTGRSSRETRAFAYDGKEVRNLWSFTEPGRFPGGTFDVDPGTDLVYEVTNFGGGADVVYVSDARDGRTVAERRSSGVGHNVVVDPVSHRAFVSRGDGDWSDTERRHVEVLGPPGTFTQERTLRDLVALDADPVRGRVYLRRGTALVVLPTGDAEPEYTSLPVPHALVVDPTDGFLYATLVDRIAVYDGAALVQREAIALPGCVGWTYPCVDAERRLLHVYLPPRAGRKHSVVTVSLGP